MGRKTRGAEPFTRGLTSVPPKNAWLVKEFKVKSSFVGTPTKGMGVPVREKAKPDRVPAKLPVSIASGRPLLLTSLKLEAFGMKRAELVTPAGVCSCNDRTRASNRTGAG